MLVDDSEDLRMLVRIALEREPDFAVVAEAADGLAGVETVGKTRPDLVLLDIAMPVMDGLEALALIRNESPESIVVMLSGFAAASTAEAALELGAHGYIEKGSGTQELMKQLRAVLLRERRPLSTKPL